MTIDELSVHLDGHSLVQNVSLSVGPGSIHCLVGDSGSGKTLTSLAAVGLLPGGAKASGTIRLAGVAEDLVAMDQPAWADVRGARIGYVGQNALGCLHPAYTIGFQLAEAIRRHRHVSRTAARGITIEALSSVGLADAELIAEHRPAQLSGGMCQRVALAIALCNHPHVLIADEPTTALDNETQDHIFELIRSRASDDGLGVLLITHDQDVVDEVADDVTSIRDGVSSPGRMKQRPPLRSSDRVISGPAGSKQAALEISNVSMTYGRRGLLCGAASPTLNNVSLAVPAGTTVGLVGRSGSGKTTLAQIVAGIIKPTAGEVRIDGSVITGSRAVDRRKRADLVQYIFQDPLGSLNPRRSVVAQIADVLIAAGVKKYEARERARSTLVDVGLTPAQVERRPTQLSGGQCQRVGIARASIRRPRVVVLDEPVSALDWSIRAEILSILADLQTATSATYLLIAHERPLIEEQCDQIYEVVDTAVLPL